MKATIYARQDDGSLDAIGTVAWDGKSYQATGCGEQILAIRCCSRRRTRFLLRLPYGKRAAGTESFDFEEIPTPDHDGYLWGSGAVACALLLAEGFVASGWKFDPDDVRQIDGLPVHVYDDEGESTMKPSLPAVNFGMPLIDSHTCPGPNSDRIRCRIGAVRILGLLSGDCRIPVNSGGTGARRGWRCDGVGQVARQSAWRGTRSGGSWRGETRRRE